jgi:hypothetical protein
MATGADTALTTGSLLLRKKEERFKPKIQTKIDKVAYGRRIEFDFLDLTTVTAMSSSLEIVAFCGTTCAAI